MYKTEFFGYKNMINLLIFQNKWKLKYLKKISIKIKLEWVEKQLVVKKD